MKILRNISIVLLSLGIFTLIFLSFLSSYNIKNCVGYCGMAGVAEGMGSIIIGLPLTIIGLILYIIYYFRNKKNNPQKNISNFGKILLITIFGFLIILGIIYPSLYFGLYNYIKDLIEVMLGL